MTRPTFPAVDGEFGREGAFETELEWEEETPPTPQYAPQYAPRYAAEYEDEDLVAAGYPAQGYAEYEYEGEDELEAEFDFEAEYEAMVSGESEGFANPLRRIYPDAELMAHLAHQARMAEGEGEAEAFIGALVPLAARLVPRAATLLRPMAPTLIRGMTSVVRRLRRDPATRALTDAVPVILQRTAQSIADQVIDNGRPLDGDLVLDTLGAITGRVLGTPRSRARAVRAVRAFDRNAHRAARAGVVRPVPVRVRPGSRQRAVQARRQPVTGIRRARRY